MSSKMNLLPRTDSDFAHADYWNNFFNSGESKEFEWYGEYSELNDDLQKYLKTLDSVLMVGCGSSMLSSDLFDSGYRHITNIDISPVVIEQMKKRVGSKRPEMVFEQMDALNMTYKSEVFTVVLDKGTLDALMPADGDDDRERVEKFFSEIERVLKPNGRYIIISLLQEHILKMILNHFTNLGWMIRIIRCWNVEKRNIAKKGCLTMPVFMIVCVKFKNLKISQPIIEVNVLIDGKSERITSKEEVLTLITGIQSTILHCRQAKEEIEIKFSNSADDTSPRYTLFIVDISQDQRRLLTYGAFIVPHGRETEWMFSTKEGRTYLRESSGFDRLAVVIFHRGHTYGSLQDVQDELRRSILQLAPPFMSITSGSPNIPYLTLGDGVGHRQTVYSGRSEYSGDLLVEDVVIERETFRRLIFLNNQAVVQSEAKLADGGNVDTSYVASKHILYMSLPALVKGSSSPEASPINIAVVGVGGGSLCLFLRDLLPTAFVTGVDIDPVVIEVAQNHFGLKVDKRLKIVVKDGVEFLKEKTRFDIIMLDVDSKERGSAVSCPPPQFLEPATLEAVVDSLGEDGVFVTNVVSRVHAEQEKLIKRFRQYFGLISWYNLKEDVNRIVFATNDKGKSKTKWKKEIKDGASLLQQTLHKRLSSNGVDLDLEHLIQNLKI